MSGARALSVNAGVAPQGEEGTTSWAQTAEQVLGSLSSDPDRGLTADEVKRRISVYGPNQLREEKKTSAVVRFLGQFKSPVVLTLLGATVFSVLLGEFTDSVAIIAIVVINSVIGYLQEAKAEAAVAALKKLSAPKTRVVRDGQVMEVAGEQMTVGDILVLEAGDYVPADARLIAVSQVSVDEALLTGESLPVSKSIDPIPEVSPMAERSNMLFAGTALTAGMARAVVTSVGMKTEVGAIAAMLSGAVQEATPLQQKLEVVSKKLLLLCLGVVVWVGGLGFYHRDSAVEVLLTAISLAVAAIPEGLPAVVTLALALAVRRMTQRNAIVRHLPAVETLGSTEVICTDKTGTLTTGKMRVREILTFEPGKSVEDLLRAGVLASNATVDPNGITTGDPTEVALLLAARDRGLDLDSIRVGAPRIAEWSFDSGRKRMSVAVREKDGACLYLKGAPEAILAVSKLVPDRRERILAAVQELSEKGRRTLGIAKRRLGRFSTGDPSGQVEQDVEFLGVIGIADPPRPESIVAIKQCKAAGIRVVMITGDHPVTARAIAEELGIPEPGRFDQVLSGPELEQLRDSDLLKEVQKTAVYARVTPEHKLRIVNAWKGTGSVVAMTGDGVNDAPALKTASIGIAMGKGGTEVARQASSMILADDNFATIVSAIGEGRAIYGNIRRTIQYLLSGNLAEILIMLGAAIANWPAPLAPIHLLWINLVTDGLPSLALAAEPVPRDILTSKNRPSPKTFMGGSFYREMAFAGGITAALALGVYAYSLRYQDKVTARTYIFSFLVFSELFRSFSSRHDRLIYWELGPRTNLFHVAAVVLPIAFQFLLHHTVFFQEVFKVRMISWSECAILVALTLVPVTALEMRKWMRARRHRFAGS